VYWWEAAIPRRRWAAGDFIYPGHERPWTSDRDEFLFYDHQTARPWTDAEAARRLASVDAWYKANSPLPISRYSLAHYGEVGSNTIGHVREKWGCDLIGQFFDLDKPLVFETPALIGGPFRRYEEPGSALIGSWRTGPRPLYYADFVNLGGYQFFNCMTEVRDVAGYEWFPVVDVPEAVQRGVRQVRRAIDSMALGVLFTHEGDHIVRIPPQDWSEKIGGVAAGIAGCNPIYVTMDEAVTYVRATRKSSLASCAHDPETGVVTATLTGQADVDTHFQLFTDEGGEIVRRLVPIPAFEGGTRVAVST
jgi:hypothetical protein